MLIWTRTNRYKLHVFHLRKLTENVRKFRRVRNHLYRRIFEFSLRGMVAYLLKLLQHVKLSSNSTKFAPETIDKIAFFMICRLLKLIKIHLNYNNMHRFCSLNVKQAKFSMRNAYGQNSYLFLEILITRRPFETLQNPYRL